MYDNLPTETRSWARETFGSANLGDERRVRRLVDMASAAARNPSGKVSEVFTNDFERQGAYDFLEHEKITGKSLNKGLGVATAQACAENSFAFVAVDGSSLKLVDRAGEKDFGSVGTVTKGARGLKVISAYAVSPEGVPLGITSQAWWARANAPSHLSKKEKRKRNMKRQVSDKETQHWLDTVNETDSLMRAHGAKPWFQLDREGDSQECLLTLEKAEGFFTVRSRTDRRLAAPGKVYLRETVANQPILGLYRLDVPPGPNRTARAAKIIVRVAKVTVRLRDPWTKKVRELSLTAVSAREEETPPPGENPIDWMLLTNHPVESFEDAILVIFGYTQRWRIEEFHKTWKSGACNVEDTQLRSVNAVEKWAILLAAVATRIERLKYLARERPDEPASIELTPFEIAAIVHLKRRNKKRTEKILSVMPTIAEVIQWIAEMGGYTGKSSGGPPGSITIGRGLKQLRPAAELLEILDKLRTPAR